MDKLVIDEQDLATCVTEALQGQGAAQKILVGAQTMQMSALH